MSIDREQTNKTMAYSYNNERCELQQFTTTYNLKIMFSKKNKKKSMF